MSDVPDAAVRQAGVFARRQAYDAGWSPRQVRRRIEAGRWRLVGGVALGAENLHVDVRALAWAVALTWPGAVLSHGVAGALRGFPIPAPTIGSATVGRHRGLVAAGLVAHRCRLDQDEVSQLLGLPATSERRTAIDLLASLPAPQARRLWAWLSTRGVVDLDALSAAITRRRGWHGTAQLRQLLELGASGALSPAEDRLHALLHKGHLSGWVANAPVRAGGRIVAVVDVLFAEARLVVEIDGYANHSDIATFRRDRARQNALVLAGYVVLRFTWFDLTKRPEAVLNEIRAALGIAVRPRSAQ